MQCNALHITTRAFEYRMYDRLLAPTHTLHIGTDLEAHRILFGAPRLRYLSGRRDRCVVWRVPGVVAAVSHKVRGVVRHAYVILVAPHSLLSPLPRFFPSLIRSSDHEASAKIIHGVGSNEKEKRKL